MLYATPSLPAALKAKLATLEELRAELGAGLSEPTPWIGTLRRAVRASTVASSTSIEGFSVPPGEALSLANGDKAAPEGDADRMAVSSYARAMDHVGLMALDPAFRWLDRVILDLHFDACYFQRDKNPGRWRRGPISVVGPGGRVDYVGPESDAVPGLVAELVDWLSAGDVAEHDAVRGAMAHLNLISIHPFSDGNGRISRIVQSLVLARHGILSPELGSIEDYLAQNTEAYYERLRQVQGGSYQPDRDATPWVEFCLDAHLAQAQTRLHQIEDAAARWGLLEELAEERGWPDRIVIALEQALAGKTDRGSYIAEAGVSPPTASGDLRRLADAGLLEQEGRGRNIRYVAGEDLRARVASRLQSRRKPE